LTAPSNLGIVHHVVVEEGGGMDEFHQAPELVMFTAGVAAETRRQQEKQGSDALAAAIEDVRCNRIDEGDARGKILVDPVFDSLKFIPIGVPDVRHRMNRGGDRTLWHAADGRAAEETKSRESQRNPCIGRLDRRITLPLI
jgi:hypothetical protein